MSLQERLLQKKSLGDSCNTSEYRCHVGDPHRNRHRHRNRRRVAFGVHLQRGSDEGEKVYEMFKTTAIDTLKQGKKCQPCWYIILSTISPLRTIKMHLRIVIQLCLISCSLALASLPT
jgi:hypothetical protein